MKKAISLAAAAMFATCGFASVYTINDGVYDDAVGLGGQANVQIFWSTSFTAVAGAEKITTLDVMFGFALTDVSNNSPILLTISQDANGDGIADVGGVVSSLNSTVTGGGTGVFQNYDLPDVTFAAGQGFVVGVLINSNSGNPFPAAQDTTNPVPGRNWIAFDTTIDPNNLSTIPSGQGDFVENFGLRGNWMINANATEAVPEPATMTVLGLGAVALMRRRRNR